MMSQARAYHRHHLRLTYATAVISMMLALVGCKNQTVSPTTQPSDTLPNVDKASVEPISRAITVLQGALVHLRNEATQLQIVGRQLSKSEEKTIASVMQFEQLIERVTIDLEGAAANMGVATVSMISGPPPDHMVRGGLVDARDDVQKAINELQQGASSIQVVGRSLSQQEIALAAAMDTAALQLESGLVNLHETTNLGTGSDFDGMGQEP